VFLEEGHLAVFTDRGKQRGYESGDDVLNEAAARPCVYGRGDCCAYLVSADIGRGVPVVQRAIPKIKLQSPRTSAKL
jgi:hypothetical protein